MFLSLFIIFVVGIFGGILFEKIRVPKIVWYIILGILLGPSVLNIVDDGLLKIASYLRQIALVIILTRSGLSLDVKVLKQIGRPAIMMCFVPAVFEIIGITILAPLLLGVDFFEALLLGSVLAAVSPAIIVPRMIHLKKNNYGKEHHVPDLIMAGASCDDIFVIVLFYTFKNLVSTNNMSAISVLQIPISIFLGIVLGLFVGIGFSILFKRSNLTNSIKIVLLLGSSFGMLALEQGLAPYFGVSALLAIIVMGLVIGRKQPSIAKEIEGGYQHLWSGFEILLFVLVGCITDVRLAFSRDGAVLLGLVAIALLFRCIGVILSIAFTKFSLKEKIFVVLSYLPKATVQASIGGIALAEGLPCGGMVLTTAVIAILFTAPLGAILMDSLYKRLLRSTINEV